MAVKDRDFGRKHRRTKLSYLEIKTLPVDSQAPGFFYLGASDVAEQLSAGELHRFATVQKRFIKGLRQKCREVN